MIRTIQKFNEERTFGIEIEFTGADRQVVADLLNRKGITAYAEGYGHATRSYWKVITDSSCGNELVSPILKGRDGLAQLKMACEALNEAGAVVNKNCGLHVHHNVNDYNAKQIANIFSLYVKLENTIDTFVAPSRRASNNQYCQSLIPQIRTAHHVTRTGATGGQAITHSPEATKRQTLLDNLAKVECLTDLNTLFPSRYIKVNFQSYLKYGTIEFRQHGGTTDYNKMYNWILFTQQIVEKASGIVSSKYNAERDNLESLRNTFRLIPAKGATEEIAEMFKFLRNRAKELSPATAAA